VEALVKKVLPIFIGAGILLGILQNINYFVANENMNYENSMGQGLQFFLYSISYTVIIGMAVALTYEWIRKRLAWEDGIARKIIIEYLSSLVVALSVMTALSYVLVPQYCVEGTFSMELKANLIITFVMDTVIMLFINSIMIFKDWRAALMEKNKLEKENIQMQFQMLKNQLNPHFLFNSLNTLSSLVHIDADKADAFIQEFAGIFRKILEIREKTLVSLKEELNLADSWLFLQKYRFEEGLIPEISVSRESMQHKVPPLTLQLLLENAVKHNAIHASNPLRIEISANGEWLHVTNNRIHKGHKEASTGIGLKNLVSRYELLGDRIPQFITREDSFEAHIPLIKD
jgi:two-component system LytT family sensor kinase